MDGVRENICVTIKAGERADHEDVAVREIDEAQDAIDHRVAQRDQGVERSRAKGR